MRFVQILWLSVIPHFIYGSLAWIALSRAYGRARLRIVRRSRFARFTNPDDLFRFYDRRAGRRCDALLLRSRGNGAGGRDYLRRPDEGKGDDLASVYASSAIRTTSTVPDYASGMGGIPKNRSLLSTHRTGSTGRINLA